MKLAPIRLSSSAPVAKVHSDLGRWYRECRHSAGTSQPTAGRRGIAQPNVARTERSGIRTITTLIRLAAGLDCDVQIRLVPHRRKS